MTQEEIKLVRDYDRLRTDRSLTDDLGTIEVIDESMRVIAEDLERLRKDNFIAKPKGWRPLK